jgi:hypothetical protein
MKSVTGRLVKIKKTGQENEFHSGPGIMVNSKTILPYFHALLLGMLPMNRG